MKKLVILLIIILFSSSLASAYKIYYYHNDHLGNPVAITNQEGEVVWKADYEPFGEIFDEEEIEINNKYNYNTKELDKNTNLLYYGNRYYDSDIGRFTTADTVKGSLGNPQSLNRYVYTLNNPMKFIDPSGNIQLQANEYVVPSDVLKAMYVTTMSDAKWEDITSNPGGLFVNRNFLRGNFFDFLPFISSNKERFFDLLKERTTYSKTEINNFYNQLTTSGNIILINDFTDDQLYHERIHSKISQLSENEKTVLYNAKERFITNILNDEVKIDIAGNQYETNFASQELGFCMIGICMGSWSELYAYMAQYESFPEKNIWQGSTEISPKVYEEFKKQHPEAYKIYDRITKEVKETTK